MKYMKALKRAKKLAVTVMKDPNAVRILADQAHAKAVGSESRLKGLKRDLETLLRLMRAWASGSYKNVGAASVAIVVGAVLYFVNPFDILPDFIPVVGLTDDLSILGYALARLRKEVDKFQEWETEVVLE